MDEVKRKVYLDLFASPVTLLPTVMGITTLLGSWALGGQPALTFGGLSGILIGGGLFCSRLIFGLDKLTEQAYQYAREKQQKEQIDSLRQLHKRLKEDNDPRTERLLNRLWTLYKMLQQDVEDGKIKVGANDVFEGVHRMFHVCLDHLDRSFDLWTTSQKMSRSARQGVLAQRETVLAEVESACDHLEKTIDELHGFLTEQAQTSLTELRDELNETIQAARKAEQRTRSLMEQNRSYDETEFE